MKINGYVPPTVRIQPTTGHQAGQSAIDAEATGEAGDKGVTGRDLVPVRKTPPPVIYGSRVDGLADQGDGKNIRTVALNIRHISPRKMMETGHDLYTIGAIGWDEYEMLAFQAELHPDFDKTIGSLVGDTAQPDRPRDYINIWEKRLEHERRYNPGDTRTIRQTEHLVSILRQIDKPTNLVA